MRVIYLLCIALLLVAGQILFKYAALRATYLADELAKTYYLSPNRVVAASHGEYGPIKSNATEEGRMVNRRIDFVLRNNVGNLLRELNKLEGERP